MEITALANETLLAVFGFLTPEDLLQCRAVCHSWASLAQDPALWSGQHVDTENCSLKLLTAILGFAPCLARLKVNCEKESTGPFWSTLLSTACAISGLDFVITTADAVYAALVISRHASLGRLKLVHLDVVDEWNSPSSLDWKRTLCGLLMQISHTQGLEDISFNGDDSIVAGAVAEFAKRVGGAPAPAPVSPSLKSLALRDFDFFGQLLLQWHADTLEDVYAYALPGKSAQAAAASLLSRLPRLRELTCSPLENMLALLQCPSLKSLHLSVYPMMSSGVSWSLLKACTYLRLAVSSQLEHLTLYPAAGGGLDSLGKVLPFLEGKEGAALALRSLRVDCAETSDEGTGDALFQLPLRQVLPRLSLLTLLDLDSMPVPALLQALDGKAVPQLTQLLVRQWLAADDILDDCGRQFIHSEGVRTLLRNYPRLHVIMKDVLLPDGCGCACSEEGCHAVPDKAWCMLFGHEAGARCDVPHKSYFYDQEYKDCVAFHVSAN